MTLCERLWDHFSLLLQPTGRASRMPCAPATSRPMCRESDTTVGRTAKGNLNSYGRKDGRNEGKGGKTSARSEGLTRPIRVRPPGHLRPRISFQGPRNERFGRWNAPPGYCAAERQPLGRTAVRRQVLDRVEEHLVTGPKEARIKPPKRDLSTDPNTQTKPVSSGTTPTHIAKSKRRTSPRYLTHFPYLSDPFMISFWTRDPADSPTQKKKTPSHWTRSSPIPFAFTVRLVAAHSGGNGKTVEGEIPQELLCFVG